MNKRGISTQMFTWIFALFVIAIVLYFGITSLMKVIDTSETVDTLRFQKDVEREVNLLYGYAPGSNKEVSISAPSGVKGVCFMDLTKPLNEIKFSSVKKFRGLVSNKNLFYAVVQGTPPEPTIINRLKPKNNPTCIEVSRNRIEFMLKNEGENVVVS